MKAAKVTSSYHVKILMALTVSVGVLIILFYCIKLGPHYLVDKDLTGSAIEKAKVLADARTSILQFIALIGASITLFIAYLRVKAMEERNSLQDKAIAQLQKQIGQSETQLRILQGQQMNERFARAFTMKLFISNQK